MNHLMNKLSFSLGCLCCTVSFAQLDTYDHKMELSDIKDQWHKVELPDALFEEVEQNLNDLRIYGVTENDTLEAPYILKVGAGQQTRKYVDFDILNSSSNANGYYFTYKVSTPEAINQIRLDLANANFDWKVVLEGSHDQRAWFTILRDYRILAIKNERTDYSFSDLNFTDSNYRFYRLLIKSSEKPELKTAKISVSDTISAKYRAYTVTFMGVTEKGKQTIIDIDYKRRLPISSLKIDVSDKIDYYRPLTIAYLADSVQTDKGWRYDYRNLKSGTLSSIENREFGFKSTLAQKLRVTIQNHDNEPLHVESASSKGYVHELIARFTKPANYFLAFGKANATKPWYDILQANTSIPPELAPLTLGGIQDIPKMEAPTVTPLFENKFWLWAIMGAVIMVLGVFTLKMIQKR